MAQLIVQRDRTVRRKAGDRVEVGFVYAGMTEGFRTVWGTVVQFDQHGNPVVEYEC